MIKQTIYLPAYRGDHKEGLIFNIDVCCQSSKTTSFDATGSMAKTLSPLFKRVFRILQNQTFTWSVLKHKAFTITADYSEYTVAEMHSAGLGIVIGYYQLARKLNGSTPSEGLAGTGIIRSSGHVESIAGQELKHEAAELNIPNFKQLITPAIVYHVNDLPQLIENPL